MHRDIHDFISKCPTCQQTKYETKKLTGLLQTLPIPTTPWEDLSLDFITCLPKSQGYSTILVVVDRFSKGTHFGALPPCHTAYSVSLLFFDMVCKLHGFPQSLVSDHRDISYSIGDWVYVRLWLYRQTSLASTYNKLSKRYFGSFQVIEQIGVMAYCLKLPESSKILPMFHMSLLKPHHGPTPTNSSFLLNTVKDKTHVVQPLTMLD